MATFEKVGFKAFSMFCFLKVKANHVGSNGNTLRKKRTTELCRSDKRHHFPLDSFRWEINCPPVGHRETRRIDYFCSSV